MLEPSTDPEDLREQKSPAACTALLHHWAGTRKAVLAIDTFEEMADLSDWLRDTFLPELPDSCLVVLAGRYPLAGGWRTPVWRPWILEVSLTFWDPETCSAYTSKFAPLDDGAQQRLFALTQGHPLTLSMLMGLSALDTVPGEGGEIGEVLHEAAACWLREAADPVLHGMVEAASMVRLFNQELLESMLARPVAVQEFERLTQLSFVRRTKRGWLIHDLLRGPLTQASRLRQPRNHESLRLRCLQHLNSRLAQCSDQEERNLLAMDLIYLSGITTLRSVFLTESQDNRHYVKLLSAHQLAEARDYMLEVTASGLDVRQHFVDPHSHLRYESVMPFGYIERAYALLDLEHWAAHTDLFAALVKNGEHRTCGMIVMIPIHRLTLPELQRAPLSTPYFRSLPDAELAALSVRPGEPAGWFFYHIDLWQDPSPGCRAAFFQLILSFLLQGGLFVHSSPLKLHQDVMLSLGFDDLEEAAHVAYGPEYPARTYRLDLRGESRTRYIERLLGGGNAAVMPEEGSDESAPFTPNPLTPREQEIARLVLEGLTNVEIAKKLFLSEITVKKHLGNIYAKLGVKGKAALVQYLMSKRQNSV